MHRLVKLIVRLFPLHFLIASISAIGWDIVVHVDGLIIGKPEFVKNYKKDVRTCLGNPLGTIVDETNKPTVIH